VTPTETDTETPSDTPTPSDTLTPSDTPTPSNTLTPSRTPTAATLRSDQQNGILINGSGGAAADGSDGIRMRFNMSGTGEQIRFTNRYFFYYMSDTNGNVCVFLNIGGTNYSTCNGNMGVSQQLFDTLAITELTGTANTTNTSQLGSGSVKLIYTKTIASKVYQLIRTITYTYPNYYYHDNYEIVVPAGNTATIKLYKGGDTSPGGSDQANDMYIPLPVKNVQSVEASAGVVLGMKEVAQATGMSTFEGAVGRHYSDPYGTVGSGGDIGFYAQAGQHDAGFMIQYNIGDSTAAPAAGTYREENITYVGFQKVNVDAQWGTTAELEIGSSTKLNVSMTNAFLNTRSGLGMTFTLPAGLVISNPVNGCGGTLTVVGQVVTLANGSLNSLSGCTFSVDVTTMSPGNYGFTSSSAASFASASMANAVGSSTLKYIAPLRTFTPSLTNTNTPSYTVTPSFTKTYTRTRTPSNTRTNTRTFTNTRTPSNTRTNTRTFTPTETETSTETETVTETDTVTPTDTATPTNTNTATHTYTPSDTPENTYTPSRTFTPSPPSGSFKKVAVGNSYVIALLDDDTLVAWGDNRHGQTSIPASLRTMRFEDVAAGHTSAYALGIDGRVYSWGSNDFGEGSIPLAAQSNVKAISASGRSAAAVKNDGTVVVWGLMVDGQRNIPRTARNVISVAVGFRHMLALKDDGTVIAWGHSGDGATDVPRGLTNVVAIAASFNHSLALIDDGRVVAWGNNKSGQINVPRTLTDVVQIAAGQEYSVALTLEGNIVGWGTTNFGVRNFPVDMVDAVMVAAANVNTVVMQRDGTITTFGSGLFRALVSRTPTRTPIITQTASLTRIVRSLTPSNTKTTTPSPTLTRSVVPTRTR